MLLLLAGLGTIAFAVLVMLPNRRSPGHWLLLYLWAAVLVSIMVRAVVAALDQAHVAPRYFFLPFVFEDWFLIHVAVTERHRPLRATAIAMLVLGAINLLPVLNRARHDDLAWRTHAATCPHFASYTIPIEFDGRRENAWALPLHGNECAALLRHDVLRGLGSLAVFPYAVDAAASHTVSFAGVAPASAILRDGWHGTDADDTRFAGMRVVGSSGALGSATGELALRLHRGDRVLFRAGPDVRGERIVVAARTDPPLSQAVPESRDWSVIDFSNDLLPAVFEVDFVDAGAGAGQWSAVALQSGTRIRSACPASTKVLQRAFGDGQIDGLAVDGAPAQLNAMVEAPRGASLIVDGWATGEGHRPARELCALLDGRILESAGVTLGVDRPDIATATGAAATAIGYRITVSLRDVAAGRHTVEVGQVVPGGVVPLPGPVTLEIR